MANRILLFNSSQEYQSLREEALETKRHIFERPLITVTAIFAAANFVDKYYLPFLPSVTISFLLFNFWFTVSRLKSSSRITAYIQVVLEEGSPTNWVGWETFLRFHRKWLKVTGKAKIKDIIKTKLDEDAVPDALFFYSPLFYFHVIIAVVSVGASAAFTYGNPSMANLAAFIAAVIAGGYFLTYSLLHRPNKMRGLIEESRIICIEVLEYIKQI